ncbi:lmo0937 family membrane protein [Novosphingobium sp. PS1R-30]|uniref:Lmo0937 family membrane protein n=1 Tax=Novosphingobium anseongense TaxID=3133436 RepID=A0ABU8S013_9SPHN
MQGITIQHHATRSDAANAARCSHYVPIDGESQGVPGTAGASARFFYKSRFPGARRGVSPMWGAIALVLVILWLLGALALKITGAMIHLLIVLAVVAIVLHFARRTRPR